MIMGDRSDTQVLSRLMQRTTLCVSGPEPGVPVHLGDEVFQERVQKHYSTSENDAVERLVYLKAELRQAPLQDFWKILMKGMTEMTSAQYGFVAKRMEVDDQDPKHALPVLGTDGACLMSVAFYYNDGGDIMAFHPNVKYLAYGTPCEHMKNDKVFLIPDNYPQFITDNPNPFPFPAEAYLGIPLFADGVSFGHFGLMWSPDGLKNLRLSWPYIEALMHSLEDIIHDRLLQTPNHTKRTRQPRPSMYVPSEPAPMAQSLKPFARSLSHELRTPMQGVVGMLDMMYATVQETLEVQNDAIIAQVLKSLRENIEMTQGWRFLPFETVLD